MASMKVDAARQELAELNRRFYDRKLVGASFYAQLMEKGFAYAKCVLVSLVPEGSNSFTGKVIRQDGRVFLFDIDLDSPEFTALTDVTDEFQTAVRTGQLKPWSPDRLAYEEHLRTLSDRD